MTTSNAIQDLVTKLCNIHRDSTASLEHRRKAKAAVLKAFADQADEIASLRAEVRDLRARLGPVMGSDEVQRAQEKEWSRVIDKEKKKV